MGQIVLRFVQGDSVASRLIIAQEKTAMPFTPSHVECVTPDGLYFGAHISGGTQRREPGYDKAELVRDLFLTLGATDEQAAAFYSDMDAHEGEPYDWTAIVGFLVPEHLHLPNHAICSARITLSLRASGWLRWPLAAPAHLIDPRDLLLMLSALVRVPM